MKWISAFVVGLVFGIGICFGGMANPAKVVNFFDLAGSWDPSLAFVMGGALITTLIGYRFILQRPAPLFEKSFYLPGKTDLDRRLIGGSAIFGTGWGIAGFCPGGALPALGTGNADVVLFTIALITGIILAKLFERSRAEQAEAA